MSYALHAAKVLGNPDESGWAQVHQFIPKDKEKRLKRGSLFSLITLHYKKDKGQQDIEKVAYGREVIARIQEEYYGKEEGSVFSSLKNAVAKVSEEFSNDVLEKIEIGAVAVVGEVVYASVCGGSNILIFREGMLAEIISKEKRGGDFAGTISASGYPNKGDVLIIANENFLTNVPKESIKAAVQSKNIDTASETLAPKIHSVENSGLNACVFVLFSEKDEILPQITTQDTKEDQIQASQKILGKNLFSKLSERIPRRRLFIKSEIGDLEDRQRRKVAASVGIILLVLLVTSIFFGVRQKKNTEQKDLYLSSLTSARHELDEAREISDLNPERARELFASSDAKIKELVSLGIEDEEITTLKNDLEDARGEILGEYTKDTQLYLDLTLLTDNFNGERIAVSEDTIYILDTDSEKIVSVSLENKKTQIVAGPSILNGPSDIAAYSGRVFVLSSEGIEDVNDKDIKMSDFTSTNNWIISYASNIYVLDKETSQIWKYVSVGDGFSSPTKWLSEDQEVDLFDAISWVIDSNIWVLKEGSKVLRFSQGVRQNFSMEGIYPELENPIQIFTDENLKNLYFLEHEKGRVVVVNKEGKYEKQYISEKIKDAEKIAVSEKSGKIILLESGKLYSIEL